MGLHGDAAAPGASLKNPPKTVEEYLVTLEEQGLSRFSQAVRHYAAEL